MDVAIVGRPESLFEQGIRLSPAAQHLRTATHEGLVSLDATGQVIPALAERWIVTDDGLSYIFRIRERDWPDGEAVNAGDVRSAINDLLRRLEGTSLGLDLAKVTEVRAMTDRIVELRLTSPMPEFLRLLAQPELGLVKDANGAGPMMASREEDLARLSILPPGERGLPQREGWEDSTRPLLVQAMPVRTAIKAFSAGEVDLLLNGGLAGLPDVEIGPLSRGTIQVDPALGLFGLVVRSDSGVLSEPATREALSMAIERAALLDAFGIGGWQPRGWIVPADLFPNSGMATGRWSSLSLADRRGVASRRIAAWRAENDGREPVVRIGLPAGSGSDLLFRRIAQDWAQIGVRAVKVAPGVGAELELRDRLARYSSPRWYLNQFNCELEIGLCSEEADSLVRQSLSVTDAAEKERLLADAHSILVQNEVFIPLGAPVRWSLVRGAIEEYQPNQWGLHPLFPLAGPTI
ncbi:MAG: ABC transporter substrate-binding protein [Pseudomonadota bacterium]|nr:ABC transporter substrate-binding protein [Pseudomonadota bacterium]